MLSIQTNYASLVGQQDMATNQIAQTKTIQSLTSGYRINSSGDDAAGLAVANGYRSNVAELTQGVINANSAVSQLQIMDGGLNNVSHILDRLKTLASQSASSTFTGNRVTLNNEYQSLLTEINRQASNIGLQTNGANSTALSVYIGGGNIQSNSKVNIDLTGNSVDVTGLGLSGTNLLTAGTVVQTGNAINTLANGSNLLTGAAAGGTQVLTFNTAGGGSFTATISSTDTNGISVSTALQQLNNTLNGHGLAATVDSTSGKLMISGSPAFTMSAGNLTGGAASAIVTGGSTVATNAAMNSVAGAAAYGNFVNPTDTETLTFASGGSTVVVTLNQANGDTVGHAVQTLNTQLASLGINAVQTNGGGIEFESNTAFTYGRARTADAMGAFAGAGVVANGTAATAPSNTGSSTGNSLSAVTAVMSAVSILGSVQGKIGAGENTLAYAISLAQSQITNFQSAQAQIRDTDVAAEAAALSKASVLQQASIAAMAQANSAPQAVLKLLG